MERSINLISRTSKKLTIMKAQIKKNAPLSKQAILMLSKRVYRSQSCSHIIVYPFGTGYQFAGLWNNNGKHKTFEVVAISTKYPTKKACIVSLKKLARVFMSFMMTD